MKAKINFSGSGIKKFFVNNGEKLFLVLTALVLLAFLYSAIMAKPLDDSKSPDAIKREAGQLVATLQSATWSTHRDEMGLAAPHFKQQADATMRPISGQKLKPVHDWNPPLFPELVKRVDPEIYAVEELQIGAGRGIVPYHAAANANAAGAGPGMGPGIGPGHGPGMGGPGFGPGGPGFGPGGPGFGPGGPGGLSMGAGGGRVDPNGSLPGVHAPGADAQGKTYVIITGAVPVEKEAEEFRRRFEYAVPAVLSDVNQSRNTSMSVTQSDTPHYFCFLVDRCEVKDADDKTRNWTPILSKTNYVNSQAIMDIAKWSTTAPEIAHLDDVFQPDQATWKGAPFNAYITWPLPPLFLKNWGFEAAHPKVKLNIAQEAAPEAAPEGGQGGANLDNTTPGARGRFSGPNYGPGGPGGMRGPGGPPMGPGGPGIGPGGGNRLMQGMAEQFVDPYRLFRFVDLAAEPGKTYRYRVQLLMSNPNFGLSTDCLDPKAIQANSVAKKYVESQWTESAAITVPHEYQVLADGVNVPGGRLSELKARINLLAIAKTPASDSVTGGGQGNNKDTYVEVVKDIDVPLGGIVYLPPTDIDKVLDMSAEAVRKVEKITVDTDQTVLLDVRNDKPLGDGRVKEATELLLMDGNGNVFDASRAADRLVYEDYQQRTKPPAEMKESTGEATPYHPGGTNLGPGTGPGHAGPGGTGKGPGKGGPGSGPGKGAK